MNVVAVILTDHLFHFIAIQIADDMPLHPIRHIAPMVIRIVKLLTIKPRVIFISGTFVVIHRCPIHPFERPYHFIIKMRLSPSLVFPNVRKFG